MSATLIYSVMRVLNCGADFQTDGTMKIKSSSVPLSAAFLACIKRSKSELKERFNFACPTCAASAICEEGDSYFLSYCPNGHGQIRNEAKAGYTTAEAQAEFQQIRFELQERLALMTEDGRNETDALNEISQQIILDLFTNGKAYE